jgi:hypothetical protein
MDVQTTVRLTFHCPNGNKIVVETSAAKPRGTQREIDDMLIPLRCNTCGWQGQRHGRDRKEQTVIE